MATLVEEQLRMIPVTTPRHLTMHPVEHVSTKRFDVRSEDISAAPKEHPL
jgi:hypothetical protein